MKKNYMRKRRLRLLGVIGGLLLLGMVVLLCGAIWKYKSWQESCEARAAQYREIAATEKAWILDCQLPEGMILHEEWSVPTQTVVPYFSSIAALGLMSGTVTEEQAAGARAYQEWYLDHLNTQEQDLWNGAGTIYDYQITQTESGYLTESTDSYDSVDSYAAMFLILVEAYAKKVDTTLIETRWEQIDAVIQALYGTIQENHLSQVKAEYPVQYLMDNCECYVGLKSAAALCRRMDQPDEALETAAEQLKDAIEHQLWDAAQSRYEIGLMEGRPIEVDDWSRFYPNGVAQIFPVSFQILSPEDPRAQACYQAYCDTYHWEAMEPQKEGLTIFAWCASAYAAAWMEDEERLLTYAEQYYERLDGSRVYPLYTGDAGWLAMACGHMEEVWLEKKTDWRQALTSWEK